MDPVPEIGLVGTDNDPRHEFNPTFWFGLINEKLAGQFLGLSQRTMQSLRQRGGGPSFCRLSARCVKYRRIDLRDWSEARLRSSTSDPGPGIEGRGGFS